MIDIKFDPAIKELWPDYHVIQVECNVANGPTPDTLWSELEQFADSFRQLHQMPDIPARHTSASAKSPTATARRPKPYADAWSRGSTYTVRSALST